MRVDRQPGAGEDQAGQADIAGDVAEPARAAAMFPGVAVAARCAAAAGAAMHPAAGAAMDGGGAAGRAGAGARAAARSAGEDIRLHVVAPVVCGRPQPLAWSGGKCKNKKRT